MEWDGMGWDGMGWDVINACVIGLLSCMEWLEVGRVQAGRLVWFGSSLVLIQGWIRVHSFRVGIKALGVSCWFRVYREGLR